MYQSLVSKVMNLIKAKSGKNIVLDSIFSGFVDHDFNKEEALILNKAFKEKNIDLDRFKQDNISLIKKIESPSVYFKKIVEEKKELTRRKKNYASASHFFLNLLATRYEVVEDILIQADETAVNHSSELDQLVGVNDNSQLDQSNGDKINDGEEMSEDEIDNRTDISEIRESTAGKQIEYLKEEFPLCFSVKSYMNEVLDIIKNEYAYVNPTFGFLYCILPRGMSIVNNHFKLNSIHIYYFKDCNILKAGCLTDRIKVSKKEVIADDKSTTR
jgi:hypothetical protein